MNIFLAKYIPKSWASRSKTLLRRRKKAIKSRPISRKKLKQESKLFNFAKEYRVLQIQKQLDKQSYPSLHINQLMDQIFYPDVALAKQQATKLHLSMSLLRQYNFNEKEEISQISKSIKQKILASQLIQVYNENKQHIELNDCITLFKRLQRYFKRYDRIKQQTQKKWKKMNQNMKKKDKNYQQKKCPYIFIDKQDIYHYTPWNTMIDHLILKMESKIEEESTIIWSMLGLAQIIELVYKGTEYVPFKIFQIFYVFVQKISEQQLSKIKLSELDQILKSINLQTFIRYPIKTVIPTQQQIKKNTQKLVKINKVKQLIILKMLSDPKIDSYQISTVLKSLRFGIAKLNQQIEYKLRIAVFGNLSDMPFEKIVDLFEIYLKNVSLADEETMITLKFDIFRKSSNALNKAHLFKCLQFVNKRYLNFSIPQQTSTPTQQIAKLLKIQGFDILKQIVNKILFKYCGKNELKYNEVQMLIEKCYYNRLDDINILELICSQIVKLKQQYKLNQLTQLIFKVYLLGYRSPIIIQILYEQQKKRYHETKKKIQENQMLMIQGNSQEKIMDGHFDEAKLSTQQLMLQQNLIISLWLLLSSNTNIQDNKKLSSLMDELLKLYPLSTSSSHPLIYELITNLNEYTQTNKLLWIIKSLRPTRQNEKQIKSNRLNLFYLQHQTNIYIQSIKIQAKQCGKFILNYNVEDKLFIPEPWSKIKVYSVQAYAQWVIENPNNTTNYFNSEIAISESIKEKRKQMISYHQITREKVKDEGKQNPIIDVKYYQMD